MVGVETYCLAGPKTSSLCPVPRLLNLPPPNQECLPLPSVSSCPLGRVSVWTNREGLTLCVANTAAYVQREESGEANVRESIQMSLGSHFKVTVPLPTISCWVSKSRNLHPWVLVNWENKKTRFQWGKWNNLLYKQTASKNSVTVITVR